MTSKKEFNSPDLSDVLIACRVMCAAGLCHPLTNAENLGNILVEELKRAAESPRIDTTLANALKKIAKDANDISDRITEAQVEWSFRLMSDNEALAAQIHQATTPVA